MSAIGIGLIVLVCVFGGSILGMFLHTILPEQHLSADSKDVIKLGMGLIATMSALVLALLTNSAKGSFDTQRNELTQMSASIILLDRVLAHYGPETKDARDLLKGTVANMINRMWPDEGSWPAVGAGRGRSLLRQDSGTLTAERCSASASGPGGEDQRRYRPGAMAALRAGRPLNSDAVSRAANFLGHRHFSQLRPLRAPQRDRHRHSLPVCALAFPARSS